jgi:hypothetical protein
VIVDYEKAWLELKAYIVQKNSHGQRDLLARMSRVEVACRLPEGERDFDPTPTQRQSSARALREVTRHG